jgi:hypothetical protein
LAFFKASPDSNFCLIEIAVTPPPAAAARLDSAVLPLPEKKPAARRAPARADHPFKGIALILASTVFLGTSDVTAKYLSATLPAVEITWIRFLVFALIMSPAMLPVSPVYALHTRRRGLQLLRGAALLGSSLFFISGLGFLPIAEASARLRGAAVRHGAVDRFPEREGHRRRWIATAIGPSASSSFSGRAPARSTRRVFPDRLGAVLGRDADHDADDERTDRAITTSDLFGRSPASASSPRWCRSYGSRRPGTTSCSAY